MPFLNREDFFASVRGVVGDKDDPDTIKFLEDMTDTYNAFEKGTAGDGIDWKQKYEDNDKAWAKRYRNRFMNGDGGNGPKASEKNSDGGYDPTAVDFSDLFK